VRKKIEIDKRISEELATFRMCPFCPGRELEVITEFRSFIARNCLYKGYQYIYKCKTCKEGFTTTLSDDISLANFKKSKIK
jgi:hypothetical protein